MHRNARKYYFYVTLHNPKSATIYNYLLIVMSNHLELFFLHLKLKTLDMEIGFQSYLAFIGMYKTSCMS